MAKLIEKTDNTDKKMDKDEQPSDYEKAEYEAATWIIRLADAPDDDELRAEFESWRDESELNAELYDQTEQASDLIENTTPVTRERWDEAWDSSRNSSQNSSRDCFVNETNTGNATSAGSSERFSITDWLAPLMINWRKTTAPVALACCLIFVFAPVAQLYLQADYTTATAEQKTITLRDGSQVSLAPESAISVNLSLNQRDVRLLKGKAFFKISPDVNRPFRVEAGGTQATVLGTAFNVSLAGNSTTVSVEEGHVRVEDISVQPEITEDLLAGDRVRVTWQQGAVRDQMDIRDVGTWRQGQWVARNQLMSELVDTLGNYHHGAIVIHSSRFSNLRISGLYNLNDPVATLNNLAAAHGAKVSRISPWLLVVSDI